MPTPPHRADQTVRDGASPCPDYGDPRSALLTQIPYLRTAELSPPAVLELTGTFPIDTQYTMFWYASKL